MRQASRERAGTTIASALRERRGEIEQATLLRVHAVSTPPRAGGPEYAEGLRTAVAAGVDYGLQGIECGEQGAQPIPDVLLAQAKLAARSGVSLDTVLRRYFAGHTLLEDFMVEEAERAKRLGPAELKDLLRSLAAIVDRLLAAVSEAYAAEKERRSRTATRRRAELIERLLAGEPLDTSALAYDFGASHLGLVFSGSGARETVTALAHALDARPLIVPREEGVLWAWLGSERRLDPSRALALLLREAPEGLALAIGEPGEGVSGWRGTHRQARAALPVALRGTQKAVRYGEVALLASALQDELLRAALHDLYLAPLAAGRDGGAALRETLRAYFAAERNVSSTATSIEADRKTVTSRLQAVERHLGRPIASYAPELETALRLEQLGPEPSSDPGITPRQIPKLATDNGVHN